METYILIIVFSLPFLALARLRHKQLLPQTPKLLQILSIVYFSEYFY